MEISRIRYEFKKHYIKIYQDKVSIRFLATYAAILSIAAYPAYIKLQQNNLIIENPFLLALTICLIAGCLLTDISEARDTVTTIPTATNVANSRSDNTEETIANTVTEKTAEPEPPKPKPKNNLFY